MESPPGFYSHLFGIDGVCDVFLVGHMSLEESTQSR